MSTHNSKSLYISTTSSGDYYLYGQISYSDINNDDAYDLSIDSVEIEGHSSESDTSVINSSSITNIDPNTILPNGASLSVNITESVNNLLQSSPEIKYINVAIYASNSVLGVDYYISTDRVAIINNTEEDSEDYLSVDNDGWLTGCLGSTGAELYRKCFMLCRSDGTWLNELWFETDQSSAEMNDMPYIQDPSVIYLNLFTNYDFTYYGSGNYYITASTSADGGMTENTITSNVFTYTAPVDDDEYIEPSGSLEVTNNNGIYTLSGSVDAGSHTELTVEDYIVISNEDNSVDIALTDVGIQTGTAASPSLTINIDITSYMEGQDAGTYTIDLALIDESEDCPHPDGWYSKVISTTFEYVGEDSGEEEPEFELTLSDDLILTGYINNVDDVKYCRDWGYIYVDNVQYDLSGSARGLFDYVSDYSNLDIDLKKACSDFDITLTPGCSVKAEFDVYDFNNNNIYELYSNSVTYIEVPSMTLALDAVNGKVTGSVSSLGEGYTEDVGAIYKCASGSTINRSTDTNVAEIFRDSSFYTSDTAALNTLLMTGVTDCETESGVMTISEALAEKGTGYYYACWYITTDNSELVGTEGYGYQYSPTVYYEAAEEEDKTPSINFTNNTLKTLWQELVSATENICGSLPKDDLGIGIKSIHDALISHFALTRSKTTNLTPADYMKGIAVAARYYVQQTVDTTSRHNLSQIVYMLENRAMPDIECDHAYGNIAYTQESDGITHMCVCGDCDAIWYESCQDSGADNPGYCVCGRYISDMPTLYYCPVCNKPFTSEEEALNCDDTENCPANNPGWGHVCTICGSDHYESDCPNASYCETHGYYSNEYALCPDCQSGSWTCQYCGWTIEEGMGTCQNPDCPGPQ